MVRLNIKSRLARLCCVVVVVVVVATVVRLNIKPWAIGGRRRLPPPPLLVGRHVGGAPSSSSSPWRLGPQNGLESHTHNNDVAYRNWDVAADRWMLRRVAECNFCKRVRSVPVLGPKPKQRRVISVSVWSRWTSCRRLQQFHGIPGWVRCRRGGC